MLPQALSVNEALSTFPALIGSLAGVKPVVDLQLLHSGVAFIDEPFATVGAGVGLVFDVSFHVFFQLFLLLELNATAVAEEKL